MSNEFLSNLSLVLVGVILLSGIVWSNPNARFAAWKRRMWQKKSVRIVVIGPFLLLAAILLFKPEVVGKAFRSVADFFIGSI